ncbi:hypothetical protein JCM8547_006894 [Rhodosporidiobolus lusitaniae]
MPGKGKARALDPPSSSPDFVFLDAPPSTISDPRLADCAIYMEPCRPVSDPYASSLRGWGGSRVPYGLFIGKQEDKHVLCLGCAVSYLCKKVADKSRKVFPVKCVECT